MSGLGRVITDQNIINKYKNVGLTRNDSFKRSKAPELIL